MKYIVDMKIMRKQEQRICMWSNWRDLNRLSISKGPKRSSSMKMQIMMVKSVRVIKWFTKYW